MEGIVLINKPCHITSRDVVNRLNHLLETKRIGHTGTLDPIATGVLVCCIGKYTKLVNDLTALDKEYIATIKLGIKTDTADITGKVIEEKKRKITKEEIDSVFKSFLGKQIQTVPKYSAIKIKGKKLYEYARNNEEVVLPQKEVYIYKMELINFNEETITFKTKVSKGTYIRSLIEDICKKLDTVGTMQELIRTKQGQFSIENAYSIKDIEEKNYKILKVEDIFNDPKIEVDEVLLKKIRNGAKLPNIYNIENRVLFCYKKECIAIYENVNNELKSYIQL